jgi:predicted nucleic acid-binding protein
LPKRSAVIDSSCIVSLDVLNLLPQLTYLFENIYIPKAVRRELYDVRSTRDRLRALLRQYAVIRRCNDYDQAAVNILWAERHSEGSKDLGEVEAVVQAAKLGAVAVVDDPWGRELAARFRLDYHGTLWILERLCELRLLFPAVLREHLLTLRARGRRFPLDAANGLLERVGEQGI